jgi:hypothetical protein
MQANENTPSAGGMTAAQAKAVEYTIVGGARRLNGARLQPRSTLPTWPANQFARESGHRHRRHLRRGDSVGARLGHSLFNLSER